MDRDTGCNERHGSESPNVPSAIEILSNATHALQGLLLHVADLLMPQDCFVCGGHAGGDAVCAACSAELPLHPAAVCPVCAEPTGDARTCGRCLRHPPAFDATWAVFDYAFPVDAMLHALKYRHRLALADFFAAAMLRAGARPRLDLRVQADVILPMPLHPRRLAERGFNQAVEMARPIARAAGLPLELAAVRRVRNTVAQAGLDREARRRNPRGAFVSNTSLSGLRVVVVDDVMTTGATLDELAGVLKQQGAAWVGNLVVARTPAPD